MLANLLPEHTAGLAVQVAGDLEAAGNVPEVGNQNQRDVALFLPRDRRNLGPAHEPAVGPDAVAVEPARDPGAEGKQTGVIHEHHRLAEGAVRLLADELGGEQEPARHGAQHVETVVDGTRTSPCQQRMLPALPVPDQINGDFEIGPEKSETEYEEQTRCAPREPRHERLRAHQSSCISSEMPVTAALDADHAISDRRSCGSLPWRAGEQRIKALPAARLIQTRCADEDATST